MPSAQPPIPLPPAGNLLDRLCRALRARLAPRISLLIGLLLLHCAAGVAQTIRVVSWDMQLAGSPAGAQFNQEMLQRAAGTLRQLNPDVILLQGVTDWQTCNLLAQALKPAQFTVGLCSSFPDPATGKPANQQLSILSKQKPYFFWSEAWRAPEAQKAVRGGFAFIALQGPRQRLGFYCVDLSDQNSAELAVEQLLEHVKTVKRWEANSVATVLVGGGFAAPETLDALPAAVARLQERGFADACFDLSPDRRISGKAGAGGRKGTTTCLLAEGNALGVNPQEVSTSGNLFVVCDLELDPAKVAAGWPARAQELERRSMARRAEEETRKAAAAAATAKPAERKTPESFRISWWLVVPSLVGLLGLGIWLRRTRRPLALPPHTGPALLPGGEGGWGGASSYTVVLSPQSATGSAEKDGAAPAAPNPVVHLEPPPAQTQSAGTGWNPRSVMADEATRTRLLTDLGRWLKQKLVRSLIVDRQKLLEAQRTAALKARAVDERLAKVEQQIQHQTREYELRIEELTRELIAAKEENRELIRARIAQVKLEMAAVRAKALAQAREE